MKCHQQNQHQRVVKEGSEIKDEDEEEEKKTWQCIKTMLLLGVGSECGVGLSGFPLCVCSRVSGKSKGKRSI